MRLAEVLKIGQATTDAYGGLLVVVEAMGQRYALLVDEVLGQQQVVVKMLTGGLGRAGGICGATIMGDGRVGLILDAAMLLKTWAAEQREGHRDALRSLPGEAADHGTQWRSAGAAVAAR